MRDIDRKRRGAAIVIPSGFAQSAPAPQTGPVLVVGSRGNIGTALLARLDSDDIGQKPIALDTRSGAMVIRTIRSLTATLRSPQWLTVVIAIGQTDPRANRQTLDDANVRLPGEIIEPFLDTTAPCVRFLTLGSALEALNSLARANPYLASKCKLSDWMSTNTGAGGDKSGQLLHLRLHTVYGGQTRPHMFLGQMAQALREHTTFRMSSGEQLREFHAVETVANSLATLLRCQWTFGPIATLSHGRPLTLRELAEAVFEHFACPELLQTGALQRSEHENLQQTFEPAPRWVLGPAADRQIGPIQAWLRLLVDSQRR
ncbi:MAG: NAD-dependent epimerase/dehydratase family protein [Gammaproteobacteria bacterium]|nr:NAD-dependent epimerase/dehydratase family protein [Gammaproteobacteria bacterium]